MRFGRVYEVCEGLCRYLNFVCTMHAIMLLTYFVNSKTNI